MTSRTHLFLVPHADLKPPEERVSRRVEHARMEGEQYLLPLDDSGTRCRIVVVAMEQTHGDDLRRMLFSLRPSKAIDLRGLLRFDIPGSSREEFFYWLRQVEAKYVRVKLNWESLSVADFVSADGWLSPALGVEVLDDANETMLLLISHREEYSLIAGHLNRQISRNSKCRWSIEAAER